MLRMIFSSLSVVALAGSRDQRGALYHIVFLVGRRVLASITLSFSEDRFSFIRRGEFIPRYLRIFLGSLSSPLSS